MSVLDKNQPYETLPDAFIIFFCTFDYLEQGLPVYTFKTLCTENTAQGSRQKALETAKNLLQFGLSIENIVKVTGLTAAEVTALK